MARDDVIEIKFGVLGGDSIDTGSGAEIKRDLEKITSEIEKNLKLKISVDENYFSEQLNKLKGKLEEGITIKVKPDSSDTNTSGRGGKKDSTDAEIKTLNKLYQKRVQLYKLPRDSVAWVKTKEEADELGKTYQNQLAQLREMGELGKERLANVEAQKRELEEVYNREKQSCEINKGKESEDRNVRKAETDDKAILDAQKTLESLAQKKVQLFKTPVETAQYEKLNKEVDGLNSKFDTQLKKIKELLGADNERVRELESYKGKLDSGVAAGDYQETQTTLENLYSAKAKLLKLSDKPIDFQKTLKEIESLQKAYDEQLDSLKKTVGEEDDRVKKIQEYREELEKSYAVEEKQSNTAPAVSIAKLNNKAESLFTDNGFDKLIAKNKEAAALANAFRNEVHALGNDATAADVKRLNAQFLNTEARLKEIQRETTSVGSKLAETFSAHAYQAAAVAITAFASKAIKQIYTNVVELDSALTDLQIATGKSRDETAKLLTTYSKLGKQMGATTKEVAEAADTWLRQGYSIEETNSLIVDSMMLSKLGQIDSSEATKALTSAMKGYKVEVQDAISIVDKLTAVDMEAAVSAGDIATAMAETAAGAEIAGVSMNTLIGYISTVAEVTQDGAESVGTFYKTLFARMGNIKAGNFVDDETGESLNDVEKVLGSVGISLRDTRDEFRDFDEVLGDVAQEWENYSSVQKHALATAFAGTRQQEKFIVLMENYGDALKYANTAANSDGTASTKYNDAYLDSVEAKTDSLKAVWQGFSQEILDSDIVKFVLDGLMKIGEGLVAIASHIDILSVGVSVLSSVVARSILEKLPLLLSGIHKFGVNIKTIVSEATDGVTGRLKRFKSGFKGLFKGLFDPYKVALDSVSKKNEDNLFKQIAENGSAIKSAEEGFSELSDTTSYSTSALKGLYKEAYVSADSFLYLAKNTSLTTEQQEKLIAVGGELDAAMKNQEALEAQLFQSVNTLLKPISTVCAILTVVLSVVSKIETEGGAITSVIVSSISLLALFAIALIKVITVAKKGIIGIGPLIKSVMSSNGILAIISLIITAIIALVKGIKSLVEADEKAREAAIENAESLQEEADALREVSDAAKDAKDSIDELVDEIKELDDSMNNADWYHYLEDIGSSIGDLYGDEKLSSLQAINKLLETTYTYSELIQMSDEKRLEILDKIAKKSAEELKNQQKETYEAQKTASVEMIKAQGQKMKINTTGDVGRDTVAEFLNEMGGKELGFKTGSNHTILKGALKADTATEFVEKVQSIIDNYEEKYQYNLSSLSDNAVYNRFSEMLEAGKEVLKNQTEAALDYLNTVSQTAGLSVEVDLNTKDTAAEYDRVLKNIIEEINKDETISTAISQGILDSVQIEEYAESFVADHYESLYNNIQKTVVSLRGMVNMLGDVEDQYDTLTDALDEMSESGILSADTIKAMKSEYPELEEYLEKTTEGYRLSDGALSNYMGKVSKSYIDDITSARKYFNSVYEAYKNLPDSEKTIEEYEKVIEAQNSLNNAIENAEDWRRTEMTLGREKLIEQYTDLLEKQSDALDEQCDKYKDLCDIRKDLLETYQDEIDAKRELRDKQQNVADLQTQLALAKLDNSASGQAKVRELEAELEEAQEELDEYTLEQAIDAICADIDDESTEYEKFINQEIEGIDEKIEGISKLLSEDIVSAIKESGEDPVIGDESDEDDFMSSNGENYQNAITGAKETIKNSTIRQAQSVGTADNQENTVSYKTSGKLTSGVSLGKGLAGLSKTNPRKNDDVDVIIGGKRFDLLAGEVVGSRVAQRLKEINGGNNKAGDVVAYDGKLYIFDHGGDWRQMANDHDRASEAAAAYLALLNKNTYHTGGLVGNKTALESNEVFAKLMKGEFVSTPEQMDRFIKETLPTIASGGGNGDGNAVFNYNTPLIEIQCGTVTNDTLPKLKDLVDEAVKKIEKDMTSALSRTGYRKKY